MEGTPVNRKNLGVAGGLNSGTLRCMLSCIAVLFILRSSLAVEAAPTVRAPPAVRVSMEVDDVLSVLDDRYVVILRTHEKPLRYLPIWVGEMDAVVIRMRLDQKTPPRPLTLNLLESVLTASHIQVNEININAPVGGAYLGRISLEQSGHKWQVDARPSDAIGLAVGQHVPILVSSEVLEAGAFGAKQDPHTLAPPSSNGHEETL